MKFGIYTSFYKCKDFIDSAFRTIENIDYINFEWHITDDFSGDGTKEKILERLQRSPIKNKIIYIDQKSKKEMYWFPNKFFDSTFDWIILVDADDEIDPKSLLVYEKNIEPDTVLISSDFHKKRGNSTDSISYILNDEKISSKIERYHPNVDYLNNISYSCFGHLRGFRNLPNIEFKIDNVNAGAEDSYHIFWCNSYGKYLHIPRPNYKWLLRDDSESHSGSFGSHFNDNFNIALNKLNDSDFGIDTKYNQIYKETCAMGSFEIGGLTNKQVSLFSRPINTTEEKLLKALYLDCELTINKGPSEINIIVSNYYSESELSILLRSMKGMWVLLYHQNDKRHLSNSSKDIANNFYFNELVKIAKEHFTNYRYFNYLRHVIINSNSWR